MAKSHEPPIPKKGNPPPPQAARENLQKVDPNGITSLNLKVSNEFKRRLRIYAADHGLSLTAVLIHGFERLEQGK